MTRPSDTRQPTRTVKAVLFDLDNTLYDRDLAFEKWTRGFVAEQFAEEHETKQAEIVQQILLLDDRGRVTKEILFARMSALPDDPPGGRFAL
jgi:FMN phosphatase YigB (HAD superfamily)